MTLSKHRHRFDDRRSPSRSPDSRYHRRMKRSRSPPHSPRRSIPIRFPSRARSPLPRSAKERKMRSRHSRSRENYRSTTQRDYPRKSRSRSRSRSREKQKDARKHGENWMKDTSRFLQKLHGKENVRPQKPKRARRSIKVITIDSDNDSSPQAPQVIRGDDSILQRKLLGLMYTVEQEIQRTGVMDKHRLKVIHAEVGLHITEEASERMVKRILQDFSATNNTAKINLSTYGFVMPPPFDPSRPPPLFDPTRPPPPPFESKRQVRGDILELQRMLPWLRSTLQKVDNKNASEPFKVQMLANQFTRVEDIYKDDGISFAYDPEKFVEKKTGKKGGNCDELNEMTKKIEELKRKLQIAEKGEDIEPQAPPVEVVKNELGVGLKFEQRRLGVPHHFSQPVVQNLRTEPSVITVEDDRPAVPLHQNQRIPLPRTILPDALIHGDPNFNFQYGQPLMANPAFGHQQHLMQNGNFNYHPMYADLPPPGVPIPLFPHNFCNQR